MDFNSMQNVGASVSKVSKVLPQGARGIGRLPLGTLQSLRNRFRPAAVIASSGKSVFGLLGLFRGKAGSGFVVGDRFKEIALALDANQITSNDAQAAIVTKGLSALIVERDLLMAYCKREFQAKYDRHFSTGRHYRDASGCMVEILRDLEISAEGLPNTGTATAYLNCSEAGRLEFVFLHLFPVLQAFEFPVPGSVALSAAIRHMWNAAGDQV